MRDFIGTKLALINNGQVLVMLRDDNPSINFPGMWDFPGGARENAESPIQVAVREVQEELDIDISNEMVVWEKVYPAVIDPTREAVFMVINISDEQIKSVAFGDEGKEWKMMSFDKFIKHSNAVPGMQTRLRDYLAQTKRAAGNT